MNPAAVHLHIDRLVLCGFDGADAAYATALTASLERELTKLLTERAWHAEGLTGSGWACLRAPALNLPPQPSPTQLGQALAGALHQILAARNGVASQWLSSS